MDSLFKNMPTPIVLPFLFGGGLVQMFGVPSSLPLWIQDGMSYVGLSVMLAAILLWVSSAVSKQHVSNRLSFGIFITVGIGAFLVGSFLSSSGPESTLAEDLNASEIPSALIASPTTQPEHRVFTPRTPQELIDIAANQTERDALRHKGSWIRVEGAVFDISGIVQRRFSGDDFKSYVVVEVAIGPPPHDVFSMKGHMYFEVDRWEQQLDNIQRDDWMVSEGVIDDINALYIVVADCEVVAVSGPTE